MSEIPHHVIRTLHHTQYITEKMHKTDVRISLNPLVFGRTVVL